mgnify:CR=1 FL=1
MFPHTVCAVQSSIIDAAKVEPVQSAQLLSVNTVAATDARRTNPEALASPHTGIVTAAQSSVTLAAKETFNTHPIPHTVSVVELPATVRREILPVKLVARPAAEPVVKAVVLPPIRSPATTLGSPVDLPQTV